MTRPPKRSPESADGASSTSTSERPPKGARSSYRDQRDQPLAASWRPDPESESESEKAGRRARHRRRPSWRIYAVPLLVVISALAVFQSVEPSSEKQASGNGDTARSQDDSDSGEPVVRESPNQTYDPEIFSAELPIGGPFPETGGGSFELLPGTTDKVGSGQLYTYTVESEVGAQIEEGNATFATLVDSTLADPRSWTNPEGGGVAFQRVDGGTEPDFRVTLISKQSAREVCGFSEGLPYETSCHKDGRVYINAARWTRGAIAFDGDLGSYRRYAINHEVGHVLNKPHVPCDRQGGKAPVMMQQTLSTSNNELSKLNDRASQGGSDIPANGVTCKPNAWPFPAPSPG